MRRVLLGGLLWLSSCAAAPRTGVIPPWPTVATSSSHYSGSVVSGPLRPAMLTAAARTPDLIAQVSWTVLARTPDVPSESINSRARLLLSGGGSPLLGSPVLTAGVRLVSNAAAASLLRRLTQLAPDDGRLLAQTASASRPGVTSVFAATVSDQELQLAVTPEPATPATPETLEFAYTEKSPVDAKGASPQTSETAVFDQPIPGGRGTVVVLTPIHADYPTAMVLAMSVRVRPSTASRADLAASSGCDIDLERSARQLATAPASLPVGISASAGVQSALTDLAQPPRRRASLTYLADESEAPLCTDLALIADNATLAHLSDSITSSLATLAGKNAAASPAALGWLLDHSAFDLLTGLADSPESGRLSPELSTLLLQFCGEPARHPPALDEIDHGLVSEDDLHNRIVAQNFLFLSDASPAARVRAFDWLNSRKLAPPGYDPLGNPRDRRRAINRATSQP